MPATSSRCVYCDAPTATPLTETCDQCCVPVLVRLGVLPPEAMPNNPKEQS